MKSRRWSILIVLILLNYLVFANLFNLVLSGKRVTPTPTRTPKPTYTPGLMLEIITPTPLPASSFRSTQPTTSTFRIHVVQQGETLAVIAQKYGVTVEAILKANDLEKPESLYPGQTLRIPY
ncbi:MAG TPA: LysM domain-containing protein [Chloroflexi bacterium]|nr:LysM domain-containing protein [Chloroflexota bacterium]